MADGKRIAQLLRANGPTIALVVVILALVGLGIRWAAQGKRPARQAQVRMITAEIKTPPPPPPPKVEPKEEPKDEPKQEEEESKRLVEVKATDVPPPEMEKSAPAGGAVALAGDATGEADAFGLEGSRSGRSLVGSGGVGDGGGEGIGTGEGDGNRFGWYFARVSNEIQKAFQKNTRIKFAEARVKIRIWVDPASGEVSRVQLMQSTGDADLDRAIEAVRVKLGSAIPPDLPNPSVYLFTARPMR